MAHNQTCSALIIYNNLLTSVKIKAIGENGHVVTSGNLITGDSWILDLKERAFDNKMITISADVKDGRNPETFQVNYFQGINQTYIVYLTGVRYKTSFISGKIL
ncbi:hypothetical protein [Clostridium tertium]|uniref:Uncharacterized protein n=1 Tax=Clostridium tertium TaxID=1559 RepID=A0A6N3EWU2_9CLOT